MKTTDRHRTQRVVFTFTAAAVLLGATAFAKMANFYVERGRMRGIASLVGAENDPNRLTQCLGEAKKAADALKQKNLFVIQPPKQNPVKQVDGILGSETLIAGKWYKVGDKVGDATIVEIRATMVKVSWDGKETMFAPIGATAAASAPPPVAKAPPKEETPEPAKPASVEAVKVEAPAPVEEDPLAWLGVKLSPRMRALLLEKWNSASDEEKQQAQAEWNKMSDEQKQQAVDAMEQQM